MTPFFEPFDLGVLQTEKDVGRQIEELCLDVVLVCPAYRLVFRAVAGEGIDERANGQRVGISQDGDGRLRLLARYVRQQVGGVVQPFDEHKVRPGAI